MEGARRGEPGLGRSWTEGPVNAKSRVEIERGKYPMADFFNVFLPARRIPGRWHRQKVCRILIESSFERSFVGRLTGTAPKPDMMSEYEHVPYNLIKFVLSATLSMNRTVSRRSIERYHENGKD
jgi:hypothetical protein